jgi:hypothetical protein
MCLFRAVDSSFQTVDFYLSERGTAKRFKPSSCDRWRIPTIGRSVYWRATASAAMPRLFVRLQRLGRLRTVGTAERASEGIEAAQMIRTGQVLGITRSNLTGQAWAFAALLGLNGFSKERPDRRLRAPP